ncbi:GDSL-type esterase/lipase family protein [Alkalilimnicola sp. S0819]|uniref:GDSL-type esterase/lipase family protein n=1 Tax=Alkalilimnicola sp. S0819 TaxID=2613922 RepID=UPI00126187DD|nr:GDSL-type esterase/lipase family protein [Alkalilimnicola sp. S0819]KAB7627683.1 arylesterase [Alkalilimnicola sp. S0819]MPQ15851.1 arylesterase [Alkalilimnicola sp. S0819]
MRRLLLLLLATGLLFACERTPPQYPVLPAGSTVLAFGDSVTHGTGAPDGADFPARLAALSQWRVINAGVPGDTAAAARHRLLPLLEEHRPALVLVELGGNDFLRRRSTAAVKEDLRAILGKVRAHGAQPVLVAVPAPSAFGAVTGRLSDAQLYRELAEEEAVPLVAGVFSEVLSQDDLRADRIHPNAAGYRRFAEGLADSLRRHGLLE